MSRLRRITQIVTFVAFIGLLVHAAGLARSAAWAPPEMFLRLSPLAALTTMLASKAFIWRYAPALVVLALAVSFGRFFCGWVCPLGSTLDATDTVLARARKGREPRLYDGRRLKYYVLAFLVVGAPLGITATGWLDPLSIATRSYGLTVLPYAVWLSNGVALGLQDLPAGPVGDAWRGASHTVLADPSAGVYHYHVLFFLLFVAILAVGVWRPRYWCRNLCPLGALLGLASQKHLLKRSVSDQCVSCHKCERVCPMGCITGDGKDTLAGECILCLRCQAACPTDAIRFVRRQPCEQDAQVDLTKRGFLATLGATAVALPALRVNTARHRQRQRLTVLRPPGARDEDEFLARCVRCGECMRVCPTRGLQPCAFEAGVEGLWTPRLVPRMGYCVYDCTLCGSVCPSQAIEKLPVEAKHARALGKARFDRSRCIPWRGHARFREGLSDWKDANCGTCEEACPVKAIQYTRFVGEVNGKPMHIDRPYVVEDLCVGCGFCENVCPVPGDAAVRVEGPAGVARIAEDVASPAGARLDLAAVYPADVGGWALAGKPGVYVGGKELYDLIDGAGEPYLTYAFVQLAEGKYQKGRMELVARVWEFATVAEGYGGYSYDVSRGAEEAAAIGHTSARSAAELWVWRGGCFVHVADFGQDPAPRGDVEALAKALAAQLPEAEPTRPAVVGALPTDGLQPISIAYFHHDELAVPDALPGELAGPQGLGIGAEAPAAFAAYKGRDGKTACHVAVVEYADEAAATKALERCLALRREAMVARRTEPQVFQVDRVREAFVRRGQRVGAVRAQAGAQVLEVAAQLAESLGR